MCLTCLIERRGWLFGSSFEVGTRQAKVNEKEKPGDSAKPSVGPSDVAA